MDENPIWTECDGNGRSGIARCNLGAGTAMKALVLEGCGFIGSLSSIGFWLRVIACASCGLLPEQYRPPLAGVEFVAGSYADAALLPAALDSVDVV